MKNKLTALAVMVIILGFSITNIVFKYDDIAKELKKLDMPTSYSQLEDSVEKVKSVLNEEVILQQTSKNIYAVAYKFLHKNTNDILNVIRDKNNTLYPINLYNDINLKNAKDKAKSIRIVKDIGAEFDTQLVLLLLPPKYHIAWSNGYSSSLYPDYNDYLDEFIVHIRYYGIDYIDYREVFANKALENSRLFYKTSVRLTNDASFEVFKVLADFLRIEKGENIDSFYTDISSYKRIGYKNILLGELGELVGKEFVGVDDYTYFEPKFDTSFVRKMYFNNKVYNATGDMTDALMDKPIIKHNKTYGEELNNIYLDEDTDKDEIENLENPTGLNVLVLQDKFALPMLSLFSSCCSNLDLLKIDSVKQKDLSIIESGKYDYVFVAVSADRLVEKDFPIFKKKEVATNE